MIGFPPPYQITERAHFNCDMCDIQVLHISGKSMDEKERISQIDAIRDRIIPKHSLIAEIECVDGRKILYLKKLQPKG